MTAILTPRIYTNRDPDAPVQDAGFRIDLLHTLEAVLVDGYGSGGDFKESLGWTSHWNASEDIVVFLPSDEGSNGIGLYLDSTQGGNSVRQVYARGIIGFDSWDGDTLVGDPQFFGEGHLYRNRNTSGVVPWWIIGTSRCLYMYTGFTNTDPGPPAEPEKYWFGGTAASGGTVSYDWRGSPSLFFGDMVGVDTDPFNTGIAITTTTSTSVAAVSYSSYLGFTNSSIGKRLAADVSGTSIDISFRNRGVASFPSNTPNGEEVGGNFCPTFGSSQGILMDRLYCYEGAVRVRGHMPGIFGPLVNLIREPDPPLNYLHELSLGERDFLIVPNGVAASVTSSTDRVKGAIAFEINVPWYPS